jgi:hypothetical protein
MQRRPRLRIPATGGLGSQLLDVHDWPSDSVPDPDARDATPPEAAGRVTTEGTE